MLSRKIALIDWRVGLVRGRCKCGTSAGLVDRHLTMALLLRDPRHNPTLLEGAPSADCKEHALNKDADPAAVNPAPTSLPERLLVPSLYALKRLSQF
jgi:hypothetical protein